MKGKTEGKCTAGPRAVTRSQMGPSLQAKLASDFALTPSERAKERAKATKASQGQDLVTATRSQATKSKSKSKSPRQETVVKSKSEGNHPARAQASGKKVSLVYHTFQKPELMSQCTDVLYLDELMST